MGRKADLLPTATATRYAWRVPEISIRVAALSPFFAAMAAAALAGSVAACGSGGAPKADAGPANDASGPDVLDDSSGGSISTTYPAFAVDVPQVLANQSNVLTSPVIVTITWPAADTNAATWEAFGDAIGSSTFWRATTSEYGVGQATSGMSNHVRMTQPLPVQMSYYDVQNFVITSLGGTALDGGVVEAGAAGPDASDSDAGGSDAGASLLWPAPTTQGGNVQTIYSLFVPASVSVTDPGSGQPFCEEGGFGYHDDVVVGGKPIAYAVTLECRSQSVASFEETATHEYVEAATNPYPSGMVLGYVGFDPNHLSWDIFTGYNDELADACQNWIDSYYQESAPFPYWVQRIWSNTLASAGHDPCAPEPAGAYYGMTLFPSQESMVTIDLTQLGIGKKTTMGFAAKVGVTATFQVGFYSDSDTAGPWTIGYEFPDTTLLFDAMGNPVQNGAATVTIDKRSGQNGEKATVTVTPTKAGDFGFQIMAITWDPPPSTQAATYAPHYLPLLISNE
jgi:hypothetical protein